MTRSPPAAPSRPPQSTPPSGRRHDTPHSAQSQAARCAHESGHEAASAPCSHSPAAARRMQLSSALAEATSAASAVALHDEASDSHAGTGASQPSASHSPGQEKSIMWRALLHCTTACLAHSVAAQASSQWERMKTGLETHSPIAAQSEHRSSAAEQRKTRESSVRLTRPMATPPPPSAPSWRRESCYQ
eukprot:scaffold100934_cov34-Tisochrysis_lutea.AAC.1